MLAKQNTGGNAAKFFQAANKENRNQSVRTSAPRKIRPNLRSNQLPPSTPTKRDGTLAGQVLVSHIK
jgi:hypothetical protein